MIAHNKVILTSHLSESNLEYVFDCIRVYMIYIRLANLTYGPIQHISKMKLKSINPFRDAVDFDILSDFLAYGGFSNVELHIYEEINCRHVVHSQFFFNPL